MAGGRGKRIASLDSSIPKPMFRLCGKPILEYQLQWLKKQEIDEVILVTGYLGHVIREYFGDGTGAAPAGGRNIGIPLKYINEESPLGTAGALYYLKDTMKEDFLLINGDIIFDIDLERFYKAHQTFGGLATILTHPNDHPFDSGIIEADEKGLVREWLHKEDKRKWYGNRVNAGIHILSPGLFLHAEGRGLFKQPQRVDLDREILRPLIEDRQLYAYMSPEYVKDMGTPERYRMVERDLLKGKVEKRNLSRRQKAVFLDRDGTMNEYRGYIRTPEDLVLLPGTGKAVKRLNESGYLVIVVTNQPVIARGELTEEQLREIHDRMETLLGEQGAYVDDIFYCPHHPDGGFPGEVASLKIPCSCRKPEPGMLLKAADKYNIDLKNSWMAGDSERDMRAGKAAGCHTAGVGGLQNADFTCGSLAEFVDFLLGREEGD